MFVPRLFFLDDTVVVLLTLSEKKVLSIILKTLTLDILGAAFCLNLSPVFAYIDIIE